MTYAIQILLKLLFVDDTVLSRVAIICIYYNTALTMKWQMYCICQLQTSSKYFQNKIYVNHK